MIYKNKTFCTYNKKDKDIDTIVYPYVTGEKVIIKRIYDKNGTPYFIQIRTNTNKEIEIVELSKDEISNETFDEIRRLLIEMYASDRYQDKQYHAKTTSMENVSESLITCESAEDSYIRKTLLIKAMKIINDCLTPKQQERFLESVFEGLSNRDIAKKEGVSHTTINVSMIAINKKIKKFSKNTLPKTFKNGY